MLCVFDIETIPDFHLLGEAWGLSGSPLEVAVAAFEIQKQKSGSEFLPPSFHRVVSIASVVCDERGAYRKVGHFGADFLESLARTKGANPKDSMQPQSAQGEDEWLYSREFLDKLESTLLAEFWGYINRSYPKLVSFNGRGFDLPVLCLRAMRYNLSAHAFFEQNNSAHNITKWENYRARYSEGFHTDLYECLGHFGAARALNLDSLCKMLDLVGKYDMSGEQVYELYLGAQSRGEQPLNALETINYYCHSDVLNTYWLFLKYELLKGNLLEGDYAALLRHWRENLLGDKPYSDIFACTLDSHLARL